MNKNKILSIHPSIQQAEALKSICKPLQALGIYYFGYATVDEEGKFSGIGLEPGFAKVYLEKDYYRYDIHMASLPLSQEYIIWDLIERKKESKDLYDDFQHFQIGHTFTIIQHEGKKKEFFHFSSKLGTINANEKYLRNLELLKKFIMYFKEKMAAHKELKIAHDIKLEIPKAQSGYLVTEPMTSNTLEFNSNTPLEKFFIDGEHYLTQRELECLHWLAAGKTLDEIAIILSITPRTVKAHVKNIKEKFNCNNLFQLGLLYKRLPKVIA